MAADVYGRGVGFPLQLGTSGIRESEGPDRVAEAIHVLLGTQHGERVMRPQFGCNLQSLAFAPNSAATANLARFYVETALARWEPRVEVDRVDVDNLTEPDQLIITISYRLRATQQPQTLSFPFTLEPRA
jgi:phage baseplate assembly protein W